MPDGVGALDRAWRPRTELTVAGVLAEGPVEPGLATSLLNAAGLPSAPDALVTENEAIGIRVLAGATELLGYESTLQLARTSGSSMARVAEAIVASFRLRVEVPRLDSGVTYADLVAEYTEIGQTVLPEFLKLLDASLRRHMITVADQMWSIDEERTAVVLPRTVGFADLVGYTARSANLSLRELTEVLVRFDAVSAEIVDGGGGQIVKTIGDEIMFVTERAEQACRIGLRLVSAFGQEDLPPVRVGLASGEVLSVFGDIYGPIVNLAARLVDRADPSTVLVSTSVSDGCRGRFEFDPVEPLELRGLDVPVPAAWLRGEEAAAAG